jgi:glycerol-3-phosphate acyltransferase PlsX
VKNSKKKIIIDAMGGDYAPHNVLEGAYQALVESDYKFELILAGDRKIIEEEMLKNRINPSIFSILHAPTTIDMQDSPTAILKTKKDSSIITSLKYIKDNNADAFVSAGNTGAVLTSSTLILGRIKGISRPTLGIFMPSEKGKVVIIDGGANVECKPQFLYEFGIMGSIFAEIFLNYTNPSIGLLNIGTEKSKGYSLLTDAHNLLLNSGLNFVGNIEGNDILKGVAKVVICDGFVGNVVLKFGEGLIPLLKHKFYSYSSKGFFHKIWMGLISKTIKKILQDFDYQKYGGVPLLGINGVVIIGHGKSTPEAFKNMILTAEEMIDKQLNRRIEEKLLNSQISNKS